MGGLITYFELDGWYNSEFSSEERKYIAETLAKNPFSVPLETGVVRSTTQTLYGFLNSLAYNFNTKKDISIALRFLDRGNSENIKMKLTALEYHFYCMPRIEIYYKNRENEEYLKKAIYYCEEMISIAEPAYKEFQEKNSYNPAAGFGDFKPNRAMLDAIKHPRHIGFEQLVKIEKKNKNYERMIDLCKQAKRIGWGKPKDWNKYIQFAKVKLTSSK